MSDANPPLGQCIPWERNIKLDSPAPFIHAVGGFGFGLSALTCLATAGNKANLLDYLHPCFCLAGLELPRVTAVLPFFFFFFFSHIL